MLDGRKYGKKNFSRQSIVNMFGNIHTKLRSLILNVYVDTREKADVSGSYGAIVWLNSSMLAFLKRLTGIL